LLTPVSPPQKKHSQGGRSALYVVLFDFWLAGVMKEPDVVAEFWSELFNGGEEFALGADPQEMSKKTLKYIERPEEVRWGDYGFHELVARGLARPAMLDAEEKRLLLEYLTPAEIAEYDLPINWTGVPDDPKLGEPKRIAHRRFAKSKGIDPDDHKAVEKAFRYEACRRFDEKEEKWRRGEGE
jgi:hypothetical protein